MSFYFILKKLALFFLTLLVQWKDVYKKTFGKFSSIIPYLKLFVLAIFFFLHQKRVAGADTELTLGGANFRRAKRAENFSTPWSVFSTPWRGF